MLNRSVKEPGLLMVEKGKTHKKSLTKRLLYENTFLNFYLITILVKKFKLREVITGIANDSNFFTKFPLPFGHLAVPEKAFGKVSL
jgi:hypothetical protein